VDWFNGNSFVLAIRAGVDQVAEVPTWDEGVVQTTRQVHLAPANPMANVSVT
jgi:hypothetical protein